MNFRNLLAAAGGAFVATLLPPFLDNGASAQTPAAASKGLPMWVIRDADSTIYITGTVHMLPDGIEWRSERLDAALKEATTLWLELADIASANTLPPPDAGPPPLHQNMRSDGPKISTLLTAEENEKMKQILTRARYTPEQIEQIDSMQLMYVTGVVSRAMGSQIGLRQDKSIDATLAQIAREQGDEVKGLEDRAEVSKLIAPTPEAELEQLRMALEGPESGAVPQVQAVLMAFGAWARGEPNLVEAMFLLNRLSGEDLGVMLDARNENWAVRVEEILKGSGVAFIAVGAGHLVGPDSLQARLALRGIETKRY